MEESICIWDQGNATRTPMSKLVRTPTTSSRLMMFQSMLVTSASRSSMLVGKVTMPPKSVRWSARQTRPAELPATSGARAVDTPLELHSECAESQ